MKYTPELGQMFFGNKWSQYECPEYVIALLSYIMSEITRVHWNKYQRQWDMNNSPVLTGIKYRTYYWGEDKRQAAKPNFKFEDVEIRWYKYLGRGTTVNKELTEKQWVVWFNKVCKQIRKNEVKR